jgi:hypothetical protein
MKLRFGVRPMPPGFVPVALVRRTKFPLNTVFIKDFYPDSSLHHKSQTNKTRLN